MLSKRLATMLISGAAMTGLGVCAANAGLLIDVRAMTLNGSTNLGTGNSPKAMVNVHVGDTIGMRVFADATGSDQTKFQCLQSLSGSFLSSGGGTQGNLVLTPAGSSNRSIRTPRPSVRRPTWMAMATWTSVATPPAIRPATGRSAQRS
jgi:hypothetical protein